jgi:hypothetical protein
MLIEAIKTLVKLLDNVIGRPGDFRTRSIRIRNPNFFSKVGRFAGGLQVLRTAGFVEAIEAGVPHLQLPAHSEDSARLHMYVLKHGRCASLVAPKTLVLPPPPTCHFPHPNLSCSPPACEAN